MVTATVTCKSAAINGDAAVVDGAAAAAAGAKKIDKHRDLVLAANPDNRFVPFAVEEGGRVGTDAEELVDAIVRAGSTDPTTWLSMKTFCMRALATTTAKGVARVLGRQRLSTPRRRPGVFFFFFFSFFHDHDDLSDAACGCDGGRVMPRRQPMAARAGALNITI